MLIISINRVNAQKVISGRSQAKNFHMTGAYIRGLPPNLYADLQFTDENGNGILEANEKASLKLILSNKGKGIAQGLKIEVKTETIPDKELKFEGKKEIRFLHPNKSVELLIPFEAGFKIKSAEHKFKINVLEYYGYDMDPAYLLLNTLEYQEPKLVVSGYEIVDYGTNTAAIKEDGRLQPGELVKVKVYIQNTGQNVAHNVNYAIEKKDPNIFISNTKGSLGDIAIGEVKYFWLTLSPNKRIDISNVLQLFITTSLENDIGGLNNHPISIVVNQQPPETEILEVKADIEKLRKQVARFEYTSNKFTANVGQLINIRVVPNTIIRRNNAIAVVFGVEDYDELPPAPYAENDARIINEYFRRTIGIEQVITYTSSESRGLIFDDVFNPDYGELQKAIIKGQTEVFVFYSGHGIPSKNGDNIFLFPSDGKLARLEMQGYNLNDLYYNLENLGAKSVTVFIDACFSGSSKQSERIQQENLVAMRGVRVAPKLRQPWENNPNFSVFTSSSHYETSLALDASQTGLFTYYLCVGFQGKADLDNNKIITLGELYQFVKEEVMKTSKKISGLQIPEFHGDESSIIVEY